MTEQEMIDVLQAHIDGKQIQYRRVNMGGEWANEKPYWDFDHFDYRVKPEPLECWVNFYDNNDSWASRTKAQAISKARPDAIRVAVHMVEKE